MRCCAFLSEGPKYGLQLRQDFEARTGEVWPLNVGPGVHDAPTTRAATVWSSPTATAIDGPQNGLPHHRGR